MMSVFLCIGCNKNQEDPSTTDLVGKWHIEFHEEEFGGDCSVEYSFQENGELTLTMEFAGERFSVPMLWRTESGILYATEKDSEEFYEEENLEWTGVPYKINGNEHLYNPDRNFEEGKASLDDVVELVIDGIARKLMEDDEELSYEKAFEEAKASVDFVLTSLLGKGLDDVKSMLYDFLSSAYHNYYGTDRTPVPDDSITLQLSK